jgi:hypothetical protein
LYFSSFAFFNPLSLSCRYGDGITADGGRFKFEMVDSLKVPDTLPAGDYVLSWRWDCEQTPQVWNSCADITVAA